jgi:hypothetical protein
MKLGARVVITDIIDAEWVRGHLDADGKDGATGMFPLSFVKTDARLVKCVQDFEAEHEDELTLRVRPHVCCPRSHSSSVHPHRSDM